MKAQMITKPLDWAGIVGKIGPEFAARAGQHDEDDSFVSENFATLKAHKLFSAPVPLDMGGGGLSHRELCATIRELAGYCGSTALAFSMHTHVVSVALFNHLHGKPGKKMLDMVAAKEAVMISTGGNDWLSSNGNMEKVDGGFRVTAAKPFASGCPAGNVLATSSRYQDPDEGWQVLHFPVPFSSEGVRIEENWKALGMRGTGSHTVIFENVFVPEEAIMVRRPMGAYHGVWNVVVPVALPIFMAAYVGVAESAAAIAREKAKRKLGEEEIPYLLGEMENSLATAQMALDGMIEIANDYDFTPSLEYANAVLIRKTLLVRAVIDTTEKALEAAGGAAYFRTMGLERMLRDVHAGQFHPLPEKKQLRFTGRLALGLDPIGDPVE